MRIWEGNHTRHSSIRMNYIHFYLFFSFLSKSEEWKIEQKPRFVIFDFASYYNWIINQQRYFYHDNNTSVTNIVHVWFTTFFWSVVKKHLQNQMYADRHWHSQFVLREFHPYSAHSIFLASYYYFLIGEMHHFLVISW